MKKIFALLFLVLILPAGFLHAADGEPGRRVKVALALSFDRQEDRWTRDLEAMRAYAEAHGIELMVEVAQNNQMQQNAQVAKLLARKPAVLILTPHDAAGAAAVVRKARDLGIKVIAYDRLVMNAPVEIYVTFDNELVGELQATCLVRAAPQGDYVVLSGAPGDANSRQFLAGAMKVIQPLADSGRIRVAAEASVIDWQPDTALEIMRKILAGGLRPSAVLAPNDPTAGAVIEALAAYGLAGSVPVTGQDAELEAARRIVAGTQLMTVFKDTRLLGTKAMELAVMLAEGRSAEEAGAKPVRIGGLEVSTLMLAPRAVTRDNLEEVLVKSGYLTREEIFGDQ